MEAGLDSLKFSYNSTGEEQCRDITGVPGAFAKIVKNVRAAHDVRREVEEKTGHTCGLFASSIRYNEEQHPQMEAAVDLIKPYVDEHYWLPL